MILVQNHPWIPPYLNDSKSLVPPNLDHWHPPLIMIRAEFEARESLNTIVPHTGRCNDRGTCTVASGDDNPGPCNMLSEALYTAQ